MMPYSRIDCVALEHTVNLFQDISEEDTASISGGDTRVQASANAYYKGNNGGMTYVNISGFTQSTDGQEIAQSRSVSVSIAY